MKDIADIRNFKNLTHIPHSLLFSPTLLQLSNYGAF